MKGNVRNERRRVQKKRHEKSRKKEHDKYHHGLQERG